VKQVIIPKPGKLEEQRPLDDEAFLDQLERELARLVRARPVGRPRFNRGQQQEFEVK